ncbi:hypothetical protein KWG64_02460 [Rahnella sp. PD12R]|uniref:hypothetical protein n=1 Tax=Rahnella sp. PD12R TaxID=2855688 RepID=UPI001C494216|nr:hypothetical protein [Rahnella sp. PD12R]MBV6816802.1 hypothetical protein [Rahnella sp. PD12R]
MPPKLAKPWARRPNWPKGRVNARALWTPALFNSALPLADYVSAISASAANAAAARSFRFGFEPARKKTLAVSHRSLNAVLKAANGFLVRNLAMPFIILKNEEAPKSILLNSEMAHSKILLNEAGWRPKAPAPREGTAQRQGFAPRAQASEHVHRPSDSAQ